MVKKIDQTFNKGRWTPEENKQFHQGLLLCNRHWSAMQALIPTRNNVAIQTHAQEYLLRLRMKRSLTDLQQKHKEILERKSKLNDAHAIFRVIKNQRYAKTAAQSPDGSITPLQPEIKTDFQVNQALNQYTEKSAIFM